jgi:hypothetical protein
VARSKIDQTAVRAEEKLDGKWVVTSNDDTLSAEDLALGYKQLMRVESCWRTINSGLRTRPVFHWKPFAQATVKGILRPPRSRLPRTAGRSRSGAARRARPYRREIEVFFMAASPGPGDAITAARREAEQTSKAPCWPPGSGSVG